MRLFISILLLTIISACSSMQNSNTEGEYRYVPITEALKKLSAKYNDYSFRIDQRRFRQITIIKVRVRLKEDQKSSVKLWYAYKETSSGIKSWDLI